MTKDKLKIDQSLIQAAKVHKQVPFSANSPLHQVANLFLPGQALGHALAIQVNLNHSLHIYSANPFLLAKSLCHLFIVQLSAY